MSPGWRRIGRDLKNRRYIDSYSVAFVTFVLAVLSLVGKSFRIGSAGPLSSPVSESWFSGSPSQILEEAQLTSC